MFVCIEVDKFAIHLFEDIFYHQTFSESRVTSQHHNSASLFRSPLTFTQKLFDLADLLFSVFDILRLTIGQHLQDFSFPVFSLSPCDRNIVMALLATRSVFGRFFQRGFSNRVMFVEGCEGK